MGASLLFQSQGQPAWAALAFAAALLHVLNHAVFKGLLFLGAGSIDRAVHGLELDRLGGLLRRMPWTGGAFLVGSMAIAGLPPLNGFVSEWLTLQALVHVVTGAGRRRGRGAAARAPRFGPALVGALATAGLAMTAALAVLCFAKVVGSGAARAAPPPGLRERARGARADDRRDDRRWPGFCVVLGLLPGLLLPSLWPVWRPSGEAAADLFAGAGRRRDPAVERLGVALPGTGGLPTLGLGLLLVGARRRAGAARGRRRAAAAPVWACGQRVEPALLLDLGRVHQAAAAGAGGRPAAERAVERRRRRTGCCSGSPTAGSVPHLFDTLLYRPVVRWALGRRGLRPTAAVGQPARLHGLSAGAGHRRAGAGVAVGRAMSLDASGAHDGSDLVAGAVQVVGGIVLAPLLPGLVQHFKGRLQGRRGPSPLQPYRELRRLWSRSMVDSRGHHDRSTGWRRRWWSPAWRWRCCSCPWPGSSPGLAGGHTTRCCWSGCWLWRASPWPWPPGTRGAASRSWARAVTSRWASSVEGLLLAGLDAGRAAARAAPTCASLSDAGAGAAVWSLPAHWLAAVAFALVVLAETGRQPVDNPDTHLELTMIHEGPLLEYAGRDLAYLQWAAAARHWVMLVLAVELFAPHPAGFAGQAGCLGRRPAGAVRRAGRGGVVAGEDAPAAGAAAAGRRQPVSASSGWSRWFIGGRL